MLCIQCSVQRQGHGALFHSAGMSCAFAEHEITFGDIPYLWEDRGKERTAIPLHVYITMHRYTHAIFGKCYLCVPYQGELQYWVDNIHVSCPSRLLRSGLHLWISMVTGQHWPPSFPCPSRFSIVYESLELNDYILHFGTPNTHTCTF